MNKREKDILEMEKVYERFKNHSNESLLKIATLVPLKTEEPKVTTTAVDISNQFLITLRNDSIFVAYKKKALSIYSVRQLDEYLK